MAPFVLHNATAREWLTHTIVTHELGDALDTVSSHTQTGGLAIGMAWEPTAIG